MGLANILNAFNYNTPLRDYNKVVLILSKQYILIINTITARIKQIT